MASAKLLLRELKGLQEEPIEGFVISVEPDSVYAWTVAIFGPPSTPYQGGYFKAAIKFPSNYPYAPPSLQFISKMWHPNVYENGEICISILHSPASDPLNDELPCERWNPTQNVRTILLSVISLLNEPNVSSPANVDAAKMYRAYVSSNGVVDDYIRIIKDQVERSREEAKADGVVVPETLEDYVAKKNTSRNEPISTDFLSANDYFEESDDEEY